MDKKDKNNKTVRYGYGDYSSGAITGVAIDATEIVTDKLEAKSLVYEDLDLHEMAKRRTPICPQSSKCVRDIDRSRYVSMCCASSWTGCRFLNNPYKAEVKVQRPNDWFNMYGLDNPSKRDDNNGDKRT